MVAAEYLCTGIISKLIEGFRSIGLTSQWDERQNCGNPALSSSIEILQDGAGATGKGIVSQRQAAIFLRKEMNNFLGWLAVCLLMPEFRDNVVQFEIAFPCF